jgi:hypothetical protein
LEEVTGARSTTLLECGPAVPRRLRKVVLDFDIPMSGLDADTQSVEALHKEVMCFARYLQLSLAHPLAPLWRAL